MADQIIHPPKPPPTPKPKRGDCGTCHWFEALPQEMQPYNQPGHPTGAPRIVNGLCLESPPGAIPQPAQVRGSQFTQQGPQFALTAMGITPPTVELRRCSRWRPMGAQPPFFDILRPGLKIPPEVEEATKQ